MIEIWEQLFIQKQNLKNNKLINEQHLNTANPLYELLKRFPTYDDNQKTISVSLKSLFPVSPGNIVQSVHSPPTPLSS